MKTKYRLIEANSNSVAPPDRLAIPDKYNTLDEIDGSDVFGVLAPFFKIAAVMQEKLIVVSTRNENFFWTYKKVEL